MDEQDQERDHYAGDKRFRVGVARLRNSHPESMRINSGTKDKISILLLMLGRSIGFCIRVTGAGPLALSRRAARSRNLTDGVTDFCFSSRPLNDLW